MPVFDLELFSGGLQPLLADAGSVTKDYSMEILWGTGILLLAGFAYLLTTHRSTEGCIAFLAASFLPLVASIGLAMHCFGVMSEHLGPAGMADSEGRFWGLWKMALMIRLGAGMTAVSLAATAVLAWTGKKGAPVDLHKPGKE